MLSAQQFIDLVTSGEIEIELNGHFAGVGGETESGKADILQRLKISCEFIQKAYLQADLGDDETGTAVKDFFESSQCIRAGHRLPYGLGVEARCPNCGKLLVTYMLDEKTVSLIDSGKSFRDVLVDNCIFSDGPQLSKASLKRAWNQPWRGTCTT